MEIGDNKFRRGVHAAKEQHKDPYTEGPNPLTENELFHTEAIPDSTAPTERGWHWCLRLHSIGKATVHVIRNQERVYFLCMKPTRMPNCFGIRCCLRVPSAVPLWVFYVARPYIPPHHVDRRLLSEQRTVPFSGTRQQKNLRNLRKSRKGVGPLGPQQTESGCTDLQVTTSMAALQDDMERVRVQWLICQCNFERMNALKLYKVSRRLKLDSCPRTRLSRPIEHGTKSESSGGI